MAAKNDPFANDTKKDAPVAETVEQTGKTEFTLTFKGGSGYDAPWLVGRVSSLEEADAILSEPDLLKSVLEKMWSAASYFGSLSPAKSSGGAASPGATPGRQEAPGGQSRQCKHGEMSFKSGSKNGKTWQGFFCPTPKDTPDQCRPEFLNN